MLQILINGKQAVLSEGNDIEVKLINSILEERQEDTTYPLTLPLKANRHIFGFPERIGNNNFSQEYQAVVRFGPYMILAGRTVITDVTDTEIEVFIATDNKSFWGTQADRYIDEMELGSEVFDNTNNFWGTLSNSVRENNKYVCVQLWDADYNVEGRIPNYYNRWDAKAQKLMKTWGVHENTYCPFPRLINMIAWVLQAAGYSIRINDLDKIPGFRDILVIHRRTISLNQLSLYYNRIVPHITIRQLFEELERKFSVRLFVYEGSKEIFIRSACVIKTDTTLSVQVYDGIQKTFETKDPAEAEVKNYKFMDKEVADTYLDRYRNDLQYVDGSEENLETIECISTIVGTRINSDIVTEDVDSTPGVHTGYDILAMDTEINDPAEFRLTVYRGLLNRAIQGPETDQKKFGFVPIATPAPIADSDNKLSLLWTGGNGLFEMFQKSRVETISGFNQVHELTLTPSVLNLSRAQEFFSNNVVIRNQRYIVKEQNIRLSSSGIAEHTISAYPL